MDKMEIIKRFTYHAPQQGQPEIYGEIRNRAQGIALYLNDVCPESREKALAFTALEEAVMWANAAIARNG